eukprot:gene25449-33213_t
MKHRVSEISHTGIFGKTLRTSVILKIFEGVSIGSTLPSLVNIFLDKISHHASDKSELGTHYFSLLVMFASGIVYLSCYEEDFTPYFYASSFCVKLQTFCSVVMYSVSNGVIAADHKLHSVMFISPTLCFATLQVVISFSLLFPTSEILTAARIPTYCVSVIVFFTCEFLWFYKFWCHCQSNNYNLEFEAKKEAIHMFTLWIFAIVFMVVNSFDNPSENVWVDTGEWILVVYCALYVAASIVLTILPNRFIRTAAAVFDPSEAKHPVHDLQDELLVKKVEGYLRVEVVDSGAGIKKVAVVGGGDDRGIPESGRTTSNDNLLTMASNNSLAMITPTTSRVFPEVLLFSSNTFSDAVGNGDGIADLEMGIAQRPQILIVDDSSANRKIVRRMVESRVNAAAFGECTVLEADDGRSALQLMRSEMGAG